RVWSIPLIAWGQLVRLVVQQLGAEQGHEHRLQELAKSAVAEIWGISTDRMEATITRNVAFGNLQPCLTTRARLARSSAIGYGGVRRDGDEFTVVARAWCFPLVIHELVKGTAELVCLHGLCDLDEVTYQAVIAEADRIDYEAWLLQAGPALWRRFLTTLPRSATLAECLMVVAKLDPMTLEELMLQVLDAPDSAARWIRRLLQEQC
ncbi:MAG: hypothetical protein KDA96_09310, partial [Planctomycetaceae bacterium]|nr:hypothetical protein [Planctomycetaceae bacterium]